MNGFVGEFLILLGSFDGLFDPSTRRRYTAVAATGVILSAVYMLWMFQRVNYGPVTNPKNRGLRDLSVREWFVIGPICAMAIFMGVVPGVFLKPMEPAVRKTVQQHRAPASDAANAALTPGQAQGPGPKAQAKLRCPTPAPSTRPPEPATRDAPGPWAVGPGPADEIAMHSTIFAAIVPVLDRHAVGVRRAARRVVPPQGRADAARRCFGVIGLGRRDRHVDRCSGT